MDKAHIRNVLETYCSRKNTTIKAYLAEYSIVSSDNAFFRMVRNNSFKLSTIEKIADSLQISIDYLIGREGYDRNLITSERRELENLRADNIRLKQEVENLQKINQDKEKIINLLENGKK